MADITKCIKGCHQQHACYRWTAQGSDYQSYSDFKPDEDIVQRLGHVDAGTLHAKIGFFSAPLPGVSHWYCELGSVFGEGLENLVISSARSDLINVAIEAACAQHADKLKEHRREEIRNGRR